MASISYVQESFVIFKLPIDLKSLQLIINVNRTFSIQYSGSSITNREITRCYHINTLWSNHLPLSLVLRPVWIKGGYRSRIIPFSMIQLLTEEALCLALINLWRFILLRIDDMGFLHLFLLSSLRGSTTCWWTCH